MIINISGDNATVARSANPEQIFNITYYSIKILMETISEPRNSRNSGLKSHRHRVSKIASCSVQNIRYL